MTLVCDKSLENKSDLMDLCQDICLLSGQGFQTFSPLLCCHTTEGNGSCLLQRPGSPLCTVALGKITAAIDVTFVKNAAFTATSLLCSERLQVTCTRLVVISKPLEREQRAVGPATMRETERQLLIYGQKCREGCSVPPLPFLPSRPLSCLPCLGAVRRVPFLPFLSLSRLPSY